MGNKTKIEWTDATWNPVTGCTKVSEGCRNCYMFRKYPRLARLGVRGYAGGSPEYVRIWPEKLEEPLGWHRSRRIFVCSMSDLFHERIPCEFVDEIFSIMGLAHWHTFLVLTKRIERALNYLTHRIAIRSQGTRTINWHVSPVRGYEGQRLSALPNLCLGVSIENQPTADERIPLLLETPAAIHFVSYEPALGIVSLTQWLNESMSQSKLDWVIAGGESGPHARPSHPDWFRAVRDQCQTAGVPFFFKQWGRNSQFKIDNSEFVGRLLDGREWNEFPARKGER